MTKEERKKYNKDWYEKNKDYYKEYNKENKENKEKRKKYNKDWYEKNKDYYKEYNKENKEKIKKNRKEYYQKNKEKLNDKSDLYKIYKLIYNDKVIYVGLTTLSLSRRKGSANYSVSKEIYKESKIELIEETTEKNRERFWIEHYLSLGEPLMNKRNGDFSTKEEAYKNMLLKQNKRYRLKSTFKPKTKEEKNADRRKRYHKNKEEYNKKRREQYKNGDSWYHKKQTTKLFI